MKYFFLAFLLLASLGFTEEESLTKEQFDSELKALKDWVRSQKDVTIRELGGKLSISGEVRTELQKTSEVVNNIKQRGAGGAVAGAGTNEYDIEVNLLFNYRTDITWANVKLEFDNHSGIVNGTRNRLRLERAFFGVRFFEAGPVTSAIEFGRRKLSYTFDSIVMFSSFMDGIMWKLDAAFDDAGIFYLHGGPFVVNEKKDHYAWVAELGVLNLVNTGVFIKYAFIDWDTKHYENPLQNLEYDFIISQLLLGYKVVVPYLEKVFTLYLAGLVNHAAKRLQLTDFDLENYAWYGGFSLGEVRQKGDWSFNINYQAVAPQAIPSFDINGIGRGNAANNGFYYNNVGGALVPTTRSTAAGDANYKGYNVEFLYLFTNNLNLQLSWSQSIRKDKDVGPIFRYKQYEMELIYFF